MKNFSFHILIRSILLIVLLNNCSDNPTIIDDELTLSEKLQKALDEGLVKYKGKGISAAVIMPDGWNWSGVSGISHGTTPINPNMMFAAGSIGKIFTGTTLLQLVEEGKISLNDSLSEWLPNYPYVDSTISIRQLLNHTGGLYNFVDNDDFWDAIFSNPLKIWTPEEMILAFNRESVFPKGLGWHYSQTGYNLLRMIIEKITGSEISTVNRDRFWIPLNLTNTYTSMGEDPPFQIAHGWWDLDGDGSYDDFTSWSRTAFSSGIGGEVWSTPTDLAKWARALFHDKRVLSQQSLDQMLTFQSPCTGEEYLVAGYGLGAMMYNTLTVNGLVAYGHGGNAPGYAAACLYFPDYEVCMGIMDNTEEGDAIYVSNDLLDIIINNINQ